MNTETTSCKYCKTEINAEAKKCPQCHADLRSWPRRHPILTALGALILLPIVLSAISPDKETDTVTNAPTAEKTYGALASYSGKGNEDTESFNVTGDTVKLSAATCCGSTNVGTFSGISLKNDAGTYLGPGLNISTEGSEKGVGQTIYRNLKPGTYYVSVISGVDWEVTVEELK